MARRRRRDLFGTDRPTPRHRWQPGYAHVFGIKPWEMCRLTLGELLRMNQYVKDMQR